jgi:hypothetical protein
MPNALTAPDDSTKGSFSSWIEKKLLELLAKDSDDSSEIGDEDYSLRRTIAQPTLDLGTEIANTPLYKAGPMAATLPIRAGYAALSGLDDAARDLARAAVKRTGRAVRAYGDIGGDVLRAPMSEVMPMLASVPARIGETTAELIYAPLGEEVEEVEAPEPRRAEAPKTAAAAGNSAQKVGPRAENAAAVSSTMDDLGMGGSDKGSAALPAVKMDDRAASNGSPAEGQLSREQWVNTLKADFEVAHGTSYDPNSTMDQAKMGVLADARRMYPNATPTQLALKLYRGEFD